MTMSRQATSAINLLRSAASALKIGKIDVAEEICFGLLKEDSRNSGACYTLAVCALQKRRPADALKHVDRALTISPDSAACHIARGDALVELGQHEQALESYRKARALNSGNRRALLGSCIALMHLNRYAEAISGYDDLLIQEPGNAEAFNNRGYAYQQLGKRNEALGNYSRATVLRPDYAEAWNNRGNILQDMDRFKEALQDYDTALAIRPKYVHAWSNRATSLFKLGRPEEALASTEEAIRLDPSYAPAFNNRGYILRRMGRFSEALSCFDEAIAKRPGYAEAINNRGDALHKLGRFDEALRSYSTAIELKPNYHEARWNRGLLHLLMGNLQAGWAGMEHRWNCRWFQSDPRQSKCPVWTGQDLRGKSIVVYSEQGFGDTFQFCRYLPHLVRMGADVTFAAPRAIHRLLSKLSPAIKFEGSYLATGSYDYQTALLSLPYVFGTDFNSIPSEVPYIFAEDDLVESWRRKIGMQGFKIGVSWQGNPTGEVDFGRSMRLALLEPLSRIEGIRLVSLQVKNGLDQLNALPEGMKVETLTDFNTGQDAFLDSAAAMRCMDLVLTTDSAPAHLAGAMGLNVFTLLMHVPDWRWLTERTDSPWYPTMKLFRQPAAGDWGSAVEAVRVELTKLAGAFSASQ